ncbi:pyruvate, water dikinase regulatory protein [Paenibacillus sp.]|uniref:pyruvate, water dikinase regulatory protein n=1 Tax=Paenibacillus sp. TaxID=58172 RepID=UPI002D4E78DA|nr:pyruvate, water dikinase regulatory protein [Paenibacillus sp.]HZG86383.1 pyruvate, water dikinase regulatory protein [Paenibacillus sp.]
MNVRKTPIIYICSDGIGETAETVAQAAARQFGAEAIRTKRYGHLRREEDIFEILQEAAAEGGIVAYTIVLPDLKAFLKEEAIRLGVITVDILGPVMQAIVDAYGSTPRETPGLRYEMDETYFRRIEAIEFAVKYDDGKDFRGLSLAQIVLIGVSRTSKTPLSVFLAHKGYKVANLPIVLETKIPPELYRLKQPFIVGLTMNPEKLFNIRMERLKTLGLPPGARYASMEYIQEELAFARSVMQDIGCAVMDVTDQSIEETAAYIIERLHARDERASYLGRESV